MDTVDGTSCAGPWDAVRRESDSEICDSVCWPCSRTRPLQPVDVVSRGQSFEFCFDVSSTSRFVYVTSKCERDPRQALPFCQFWPAMVNVTMFQS